MGITKKTFGVYLDQEQETRLEEIVSFYQNNGSVKDMTVEMMADSLLQRAIREEYDRIKVEKDDQII